MTVVMDAVGGALKTAIETFGADTFAALFGGNGAGTMKISYAKRDEIQKGVNRIHIRPLRMVPQRRVGTSGRSAFMYRIRCTVADHTSQDVAQSVIETGIDTRLRPNNPNYATLAAALFTAAGADALGHGVFVQMSDPLPEGFDDDAADVTQSGDPARIVVEWELSVSLDHVVPLSQV